MIFKIFFLSPDSLNIFIFYLILEIIIFFIIKLYTLAMIPLNKTQSKKFKNFSCLSEKIML